MNKAVAIRRTAQAYGAFAVLVALVAYVIWLPLIGPMWAIAATIVFAVVVASALYLGSDTLALRALRARPVEGESPTLLNLVEGLTVAHGFRFPDLFVVEDAAPNAAVVGRTPKRGGLVVTTGLLERLDRVELEAVLTHELTRIRRGVGTLNLTTATLIGPMAAVAPNLASRLGGHLLDADRTVVIDLEATDVTRYPPGLAGALMSLQRDGRVVAANPRAYRHLWLDSPEGSIVDSDFTIDERIAVLHEL